MPRRDPTAGQEWLPRLDPIVRDLLRMLSSGPMPTTAERRATTLLARWPGDAAALRHALLARERRATEASKGKAMRSPVRATLRERRRDAMAILIAWTGTERALSAIAPISPGHVSKVLNDLVGLSANKARAIEQRLHLASGWMDKDHPDLEQARAQLDAVGPPQRRRKSRGQ